jgi:hypothetical protein
VVDTLVVFEGTGPSYIAWDPPDWVMQRHGQLSHVVYDTMPSQRQEICSLFRSRHADLIYVTDDEMPNPWNTLPSYWSLVAPKCV